MYRLLKWMASGGAVFLIGAAPAAAGAQGLNVLIVPAPASGSELQTRVVGQVRRLVMTRLARRGYAVFDADSIKGGPSAAAQKASVAAAIAGRVARTLSAGLDAVVVVSAKIGVRRGVYTSHIETRLGASLMDGRTGRFVIHVDSGPSRRRRLSAGCAKSCLGDVAAGEAEAASERLVSAIVRRLAEIPRRVVRAKAAPPKPTRTASPRYVLVFRGIGSDEIAEIEKYLTVFPGFGEMRRVESTGDGVSYRYHSELDGAALRRALDRMLRHLRIATAITHKGRTVVVSADHGIRKSNDW